MSLGLGSLRITSHLMQDCNLRKLYRPACVYVCMTYAWTYTCISDLVTQDTGHVAVVSELGRVSGEERVAGEDGHSAQDEGGEKVGVDVVAGAAEFPTI